MYHYDDDDKVFGINSLFISYKNNNLEFKLSDVCRVLRGRYYFYQSNESASIRTEVKLVLEELEVRPVDFVQLRQLLVRELGEVLDPGFRGERPPMSGTVNCKLRGGLMGFDPRNTTFTCSPTSAPQPSPVPGTSAGSAPRRDSSRT